VNPTSSTSADIAAEGTAILLRWLVIITSGWVIAVAADGPRLAERLLVVGCGVALVLLQSLWWARGRVLWPGQPLWFSMLDGLWVAALCAVDGKMDSPFFVLIVPFAVAAAVRYPPREAALSLGPGLLACSLLLRVGDDPDPLLTLVGTVVMLLGICGSAAAMAGVSRRERRDLMRVIDELRAERTALEIRVDERTRELHESQALIVQGEKQAAFGLLAAGIAHEVGNPLAAISSLVQLLRRKQLDAYTRERLEMIDDQLRRIHRTLQELVTFSRPATAEPSTFPPREAVDAALNIAKYYKRTKGKRVVTRYANDLPPVTLPRDHFVQVMLNLILNAMDATEEGGCVEIVLERDHETSGWVRVNVVDDGHGIRPEDRPKVFEPYFTTKPNGTGLGLFVCRRIVEQSLGGRLSLEASTPGGTTFAVRLPAATRPVDG
jgi:two-component system, NtrC family, sensor kinase